MNKEQEELLNEVYENYLKNWKHQPVIENELHWMEQELVNERPLWKDMFIHCIKTNNEFSETWGLMIEERELSDEERKDIWNKNNFFVDMSWYNMEEDDCVELLNGDNIPTKLITITYNDKKIESYD